MNILRSSLLLAGLLFCADLMAVEDCCNIISKDLQTGMVTARDIASGRTFEFRVTNQQLLDQLNPGTTFGRDSVTGLAVSPEALLPDWAIICCVAAPTEAVRTDGMNKGELLDTSQIATPDDWDPRHGAVDTGTANLPTPDDWNPSHSLAPGVTLQILSLKRLEARVVKLEFSLSNSTDKDDYLDRLGFGARSDLRNLALIDYNGGMTYRVVTDNEGGCRCSRTPGSTLAIQAGENKTFFVHFTAPPADVDRITIEIPNAVSIDNVPIQ